MGYRFAISMPLLPLYNVAIRLYYSAISLAAIRNKKAEAWLTGRRNLFDELQQKLRPGEAIIWMHCSSAGEFEQGKPLIEALKKFYPEKKLLISFFSPSGYAVAHNYPFADYITYLPLDTAANAQKYLSIVKPELIIFIKYEFWFHHLQTAFKKGIPMLLASAVFRRDQIFFRSYGGFFKKLLNMFSHIFVQDEYSLNLLQENGIGNCSKSGDTRFDRVNAIAESFTAIEGIEHFLQGKPCIVAGSTWPDDERLLAEAYHQEEFVLKLIIAPHEINEAHLKNIEERFPNSIRYSQLIAGKGEATNAKLLLIDNVGMLSRLYHYAAITYVGGGFSEDGIHNILEAAVWGKPVLFGTNYKKYREAEELIAAGGAFSVGDGSALKKLVDNFRSNENHLQAAGNKARNYIEINLGATEKILSFIQEKRLLTRL